MTETQTPAATVVAQLNTVLLDQEDLVQVVLASFLAGGHVLLEGLPGLGKTLLCKSLAVATGLGLKRVQFTPDLMPADISGTHVFDPESGEARMRFMPGPVFTHFLLADEINRASPKTQSALLEAMGEGTVTHLGTSRVLPDPFFVIATQNPIDMEGTHPLPEAQLDRFAVRYLVPPVAESTLLTLVQQLHTDRASLVSPVMDAEGVREARAEVAKVVLPEAVARCIARTVALSEPSRSALAKDHLAYGVSPRGALWLARVCQALAYLDGREAVGFDDVAQAAPHVLNHRLVLKYSARLDQVRPGDLASKLVEEARRSIIGGVVR
jgi:MoxR-like ATPase